MTYLLEGVVPKRKIDKCTCDREKFILKAKDRKRELHHTFL